MHERRRRLFRWRLHNLDLCTVLMTFEEEGFFILILDVTQELLFAIVKLSRVPTITKLLKTCYMECWLLIKRFIYLSYKVNVFRFICLRNTPPPPIHTLTFFAINPCWVRVTKIVNFITPTPRGGNLGVKGVKLMFFLNNLLLYSQA